MKTVIVYGLRSTRGDGIRYVGQTVQPLKNRMKQHRCMADKDRPSLPVHKWWRREVDEGYFVEAEILCADSVLHETECSFIAKLRAEGVRLLNLTDGGEGTIGWAGNKGKKRPDLAARNRANTGKPGHPMSDENKAKIIAALTGIKRPELAERNRVNKTWLGRKHTEETKAKIGAASKANGGFSDLARENARKAVTGKKLSEDAIAALRAGHKAYFERMRDAKAQA